MRVQRKPISENPVPKNSTLIIFALALILLGTATYAKDRAVAIAQHNLTQVQVDDTMLVMFAGPLGMVQSVLDEIAVYRSMR